MNKLSLEVRQHEMKLRQERIKQKARGVTRDLQSSGSRKSNHIDSDKRFHVLCSNVRATEKSRRLYLDEFFDAQDQAEGFVGTTPWNLASIIDTSFPRPLVRYVAINLDGRVSELTGLAVEPVKAPSRFFN